MSKICADQFKNLISKWAELHSILLCNTEQNFPCTDVTFTKRKLDFYRTLLLEITDPLVNCASDDYDDNHYYSLFHQILGVAFCQFARSLFTFFNDIFLGSFFIFPQHPLKFGEFFCLLLKFDHLACNKFPKLQLS